MCANCKTRLPVCNVSWAPEESRTWEKDGAYRTKAREEAKAG